ncbi:MAG: glycosyl hydrolase family 28-related protein [Dehalococcoidia bacterium]|nr:glycosyl hydrolase family 28-related protein [Dehalococcoidia bacterium]
MATQVKGTGTVANAASGGNIAWANLTNAMAEDAAYAGATLDQDPIADKQSQYLKCTGFAFTLPACTVNGISVRVKRYTDQSPGCYDTAVKIVKGGVIGDTDKTAVGEWPTSNTSTTYGANNDLWGETWTAADINGSGFGVVISCGIDSAPPGPATATGYIDYVEITVTYTITPTPATPVFTALQEDDTNARKVAPEKLSYYLAYRTHRKQGAALIGYYPKGDAVVGRSAGSKLDERPSVKDWGAKGDGATDDTAAIQAAIDAVYSGDGGGTIGFPHGQYKVSSTITVRDYVRLVGGDGVGAGDYSRSCGFRVYTGRAAANTYGFDLKEGSGMRGFHFWYPEQVSAGESTPTVYGWTIGSSTSTSDERDAVCLQDLFFLNSYSAIRLYNCPRFIVERVYGQPFATGIYADYCLSPCTLRDVRFDTFYAASTDNLYTWIHTNGRAFDIRRVQGLFAYNLQAKGYKEGLYLNHANLRVDVFGVDVQATTYPFHVQACDDVAAHGGLLTSGEAGVAGITCANPLTGYLGLFGLRCFDQGGQPTLITNTSGAVEIVGCV